MDDAIYVEVINQDWGNMDLTPPTSVTLVNMELTEKNVWYLVVPSVVNLRSWKIQLRRAEIMASFDYKYDAASTAYISCFPGEAVFADAVFPSLYVRCPDLDAQILELEYWRKD
jgi:hypothetical protein